MVPATTVVGCYLYEYVHLPDWMLLWQEEICRDEELQEKWHPTCRFPDNQQPQVHAALSTCHLAHFILLDI